MIELVQLCIHVQTCLKILNVQENYPSLATILWQLVLNNLKFSSVVFCICMERFARPIESYYTIGFKLYLGYTEALICDEMIWNYSSLKYSLVDLKRS